MEIPESDRSTTGKITPTLGTPKNKFDGMMPVYQREVHLKTEGQGKKMVVKEVHENKDKNDYGIFFTSKYDKPIPQIVKTTQKYTEEEENNSPLKRWKKHVKTDSQDRVSLLSHTLY
mmetsp:Transcript_31309/g.27669  ORF Transcript_31309/g.27669 Transcript_31309/m.27669 type:complete len:117 (+) Transcript_31309:36-386(+)